MEHSIHKFDRSGRSVPVKSTASKQKVPTKGWLSLESSQKYFIHRYLKVSLNLPWVQEVFTLLPQNAPRKFARKNLWYPTENSANYTIIDNSVTTVSDTAIRYKVIVPYLGDSSWTLGVSFEGLPGGGGCMFPCSLQKIAISPLFPKNKFWCSPKFIFTEFPCSLKLCSMFP